MMTPDQIEKRIGEYEALISELLQVNDSAAISAITRFEHKIEAFKEVLEA